MTIQQFFEKATEGGWKYDDYCDGRGCGDKFLLLDPEARKAVGKVEGWKDWRFFMVRMVHALAEGKTVEEYLETL